MVGQQMFVACISLVMRQACLQVMRQGISSPSYSNIVHNQYIDKFNIASETKTLGGIFHKTGVMHVNHIEPDAAAHS